MIASVEVPYYEYHQVAKKVVVFGEFARDIDAVCFCCQHRVCRRCVDAGLLLLSTPSKLQESLSLVPYHEDHPFLKTRMMSPTSLSEVSMRFASSNRCCQHLRSCRKVSPLLRTLGKSVFNFLILRICSKRRRKYNLVDENNETKHLINAVDIPFLIFK